MIHQVKFFVLHTSLIVFLSLFCAYGQNDARSQKIIDDMAAKFKSYPSVSLPFSATVTNWQGQQETEQEGKLWLKGNKYKLELPEFVIFFDGTKIFRYLPEVKEVNVTMPDPNENDEVFQLLNPQTYVNLSSKSFKCNLVKENTINNRQVYEINLYPINIKTTNFSRIRVMIEKKSLQLVYLKAFMNDKTQYDLSFKPYETYQTTLRDSFFTFNKSEHPGVEVIDLTF